MRTTEDDNDIAAAFRRRKGGEQLPIPGTERATSPAVEAAAEALREAEAEVKAATELKADRAERLLYALLEAGVKVYPYTDADGRRFTVVATERMTVKVKRGRGEE